MFLLVYDRFILIFLNVYRIYYCLIGILVKNFLVLGCCCMNNLVVNVFFCLYILKNFYEFSYRRNIGSGVVG